ncbi:peptidylprolyl isomerase [Sungkyunkwania multivorans]|uniref:Periplasmic chaperone PpiD n=1 Tax=Sungkyunkwania multivorans TaxID=1173618 RepID=A0ABW3D160_9FLAO
MAILGKIRQRSIFLILVIGMALFAFVISGVFDAQGQNGVSDSIATVNGEDIAAGDFRAQVDAIERQYGGNVSTTQVVNMVWNQKLRSEILGQEIEAAGIDVGADKVAEILAQNQGYASDPRFQNAAGLFDKAKFAEWVNEQKENDPEQYAFWTRQEQGIRDNAKEQTYFNLIKAGMGATLKEGELNYRLENDKVNINFVQIPYTSIADSLVEVTKGEIKKYIEAHESEFKVEASRDVQFVLFEEKPSKEDEEAAKKAITERLSQQISYNDVSKLTDTVPSFANANDVAEYVNSFSDVGYEDKFVAREEMTTSFADTLFALSVGQIYGPYKDGEFYKLTKMVEKDENGSAKASHILIAYEGALRANPDIKRTKEEAEVKAQELLAKAKADKGNFAELAKTESDGPSASKGGDLGWFTPGAMVPAFNDFVFGNDAGSLGVVETDFGFHVILVEEKRVAVKLATIAQKVEVSETTSNLLFNEATKFEIATGGEKAFSDVAQENNYTVRRGDKLDDMADGLPGLTNQRSIIRWAFNPETEIGNVRKFNYAGGYAVVQLTGQTEKGLMSVEDASSRVLPILRKQKKAKMIKEKNNAKTLAELASANATSVKTASALTMKNPTIGGAGREPKVVGAAFALEQGETSGLIEGQNGVYMVEVTNVTKAVDLDSYLTYANTLKGELEGKVNSEVFNALKKKADIEDNRAEFY